MYAKQTPGPWGYSLGKDSSGDSTIVIYGPKQNICTMDTESVNGGPFTMPMNAEANARLIAAAPDLLEALRDLVHVMATKYEDYRPALARATDAICKAEGINI